MRPVEITDLVWSQDSTGARMPVDVEAAADRLEASGQRRAARIVRALPAQDGKLIQTEVDALFLRVHRELQRLAEELQLPRRLAEWLGEEIALFSDVAPGRPIRIVDVGCGLGYVSRWLAAKDALGPNVELVGVDLNATLIDEARRLAAAEQLPCRFVVGDAFGTGAVIADPTRTIVVSTGLLHHLDPVELVNFFAAHQQQRVRAFAHWDVDPSGWATLGAWIFHQGRMREPVSRHDGVLSARRAHAAQALLAAAGHGAPEYDVTCRDGPRWRPALSEVLRPIVGRWTGS